MQSKIFWYGFKRNLIELYYLLLYEKLISCDEDEFISHFTGKKFRIEHKSKGKLIWNKDKYFLLVVLNHLSSKGFFQDESGNILKHFDFSGTRKLLVTTCPPTGGTPTTGVNTPPAKKLQSKLEALFPETSGLRCKTRLYYKARNKCSISDVLDKCGIS